jgi:hypothetical protein
MVHAARKLVVQGKIEEDALTITVDFMHILLRNSADHALLNDARISPADVFNNLQIFHSDLK